MTERTTDFARGQLTEEMESSGIKLYVDKPSHQPCAKPDIIPALKSILSHMQNLQVTIDHHEHMNAILAIERELRELIEMENNVDEPIRNDEPTITRMISIVMEIADATTDRGLKRYLFNAIDHLGAAGLYIKQYPESLNLKEFWEKHRYNEKLP